MDFKIVGDSEWAINMWVQRYRDFVLFQLIPRNSFHVLLLLYSQLLLISKKNNNCISLN